MWAGIGGRERGAHRRGAPSRKRGRGRDKVASLGDPGRATEGASVRGSLLVLRGHTGLESFLTNWWQGSREEGIKSDVKSTVVIKVESETPAQSQKLL